MSVNVNFIFAADRGKNKYTGPLLTMNTMEGAKVDGLKVNYDL